MEQKNISRKKVKAAWAKWYAFKEKKKKKERILNWNSIYLMFTLWGLAMVQLKI